MRIQHMTKKTWEIILNAAGAVIVILKDSLGRKR